MPGRNRIKGEKKAKAAKNGDKPVAVAAPPKGSVVVKQVVISEMSDGTIQVVPQGFASMDEASGWIARCVKPDAFIRQMMARK